MWDMYSSKKCSHVGDKVGSPREKWRLNLGNVVRQLRHSLECRVHSHRIHSTLFINTVGPLSVSGGQEFLCFPSKHEISSKCLCNVGPQCTRLAQHHSNVKFWSISRVRWVITWFATSENAKTTLCVVHSTSLQNHVKENKVLA